MGKALFIAGPAEQYEGWNIGMDNMLFLAGLMGMMALGGAVFVGLSPADDLDEIAARDADGDGDAELNTDAEESGSSILDFLGMTDAAKPDDGESAGDVSAPGADLVCDAYTDTPTADGAFAADIAGSSLQSGDVGRNDDTAQRVAVGTAQDDVMEGTGGRDVASGYDGDDTMSGGAADDELWGGLGADTLTGGTSDDTLHGGAGGDAVHGGDGDDRVFGHGGNDTVGGGAGDDSLVGGQGADTLEGGDGNDAVHGGLDDDALRGGIGADTLFGGWGDDTLSGREDDPETIDWDDMDGADYLNGGGGGDLIAAGAGDIVTTGDGADTVLLGEWLSMEHQAEILDFAPDEDTLMVVYDDTGADVPEVDLAPDPDDSSLQYVMLNGVQIAAVNNAPGLNAGHITLIGYSLLPTGAML